MVGTHPLTQGGIATVVRGYIDAGLFDRFDCTYIATHRDGNALAKLATALKSWMQVLMALASGKAPLFHIHLSSRASFWRKSVICATVLLARRPYVLHLHGSEFMRFYDEECGPLAKRVVRFVFRHAAVVLALSDQWRDNIRRICDTAVVEVLPNAVPLQAAVASGVANEEQQTVLILGRLGHRKGTFDLVNAFSRVAAQARGARLVCAGDGAVKETIELAAKLGIGSRVECPGWLSAEQAGRLLSGATLFVLPSYAEGLPMALLEAMSWGLAVISSPVGGIPQVIRHGENGLLVSPGDVDALTRALAWLLGDEPARARLGAAARATIEQTYSVTSAIERLGTLYARFGISQRNGGR
jgi:glycosyltransferase involved in cell wall biosynthesis